MRAGWQVSNEPQCSAPLEASVLWRAEILLCQYVKKHSASHGCRVQETLLETLLVGPLLTPAEHDIVRWGRNAQTTTPTRFSKSSIHKKTYRNATALECLVRCHSLQCKHEMIWHHKPSRTCSIPVLMVTSKAYRKPWWSRGRLGK